MMKALQETFGLRVSEFRISNCTFTFKNNMQIYTVITLLAVTLAACITDSRAGIIPNRLCVSGLLLSVVSRLLEHRGFPPADLFGSTGLLALLLLSYRFRRIGGGDVKLLAVLLFLLSLRTALLLFWLTMLFAGISGILLLVTVRERNIRLGPAMFLASLVTALPGGFI